ncbi:hypothetical protein CK203_115311 [Vitis vinifera]|uniref:Uncharacterized protein n=1 Tax=Vitis vinifera TaxID=29760 RepID=A0A438C3Y0_VITVI|nr:hypothetical protein CK203_115311 [Vitis vinifera]
MVRGAWAGSRHPARPFSPNYSLDSGRQGEAVQDAAARNLTAVVREPQEYVINILPRKMPKERLTLKNAEFSWKSGEEEERRDPSEGSRTETRRRLSSKENSSEKEEAGEEWEGREGAHSSHGICSSAHYSRGGGNDRGASERCLIPSQADPDTCGAEPLKHLLGSGCRLANLAEEAASVNHPDSRNPDADAAEAVCATPWRKWEQKAESAL